MEFGCYIWIWSTIPTSYTYVQCNSIKHLAMSVDPEPRFTRIKVPKWYQNISYYANYCPSQKISKNKYFFEQISQFLVNWKNITSLSRNEMKMKIGDFSFRILVVYFPFPGNSEGSKGREQQKIWPEKLLFLRQSKLVGILIVLWINLEFFIFCFQKRLLGYLFKLSQITRVSGTSVIIDPRKGKQFFRVWPVSYFIYSYFVLGYEYHIYGQTVEMITHRVWCTERILPPYEVNVFQGWASIQRKDTWPYWSVLWADQFRGISISTYLSV